MNNKLFKFTAFIVLVALVFTFVPVAHAAWLTRLHGCLWLHLYPDQG